MAAPAWLRQGDPLATAHRLHPRLLNEGHIVMGHLVMANVAMFRLGTETSPGLVVHPRDPDLVVEVDELERASHAIYGLRKLEPVDEDLDKLASLLRAESERCFSLPVPPALSQGRPLFLSAVLPYRSRLPVPRLATHLLPVLVCEALQEVALLPAAYWAPDLLDAWNDMSTL